MGTGGVAGAQDRAGEVGSEEGFAGGVGGHDAVAGLAGSEPVDRGFGVAREGGGGQGVEVVLVGEQEDGGDAFDVGALADGRGELFAVGEFEAGVADLVALVLGRGPHEHVQACRVEGAGQVQDPRVAADQQRAGAGGAGDAEPAGHRDRGQAVQGHGGDDDQEGDGQDLGRAADVAGGQRGPEGRGGGRGDDPARRHPAGERAFPPGQIGPDGGEEGDQRAGHQHQDGHQGDGGQHDVLQRRRGDGGRDGHEQDPDDQLHQGLEEQPLGRDVEDAQVRHRELHQDRGDEPGVVTDDVAGGRHPHHARQLARGGEQVVQVKLAQAQPQHRHADYRAGHADAGGQQELAQRVGDPAAGARQHGVEHHRAQDAADRVDQRALPGQYPLEAIGGPDEGQQRGYHRRPGHHQDRASHQRRPARHAQQRAGQHRGERHRDRHPPDHQAGHHPAGAPLHLAPLQRQAGVIQDHRHRERDQRLERRAQQALRVDVGGERARDEACREQDDQRRDAQPARQHLRAHREHQDQSDPGQDLVGGHCLLSSPGFGGYVVASPGTPRSNENHRRYRYPRQPSVLEHCACQTGGHRPM